MTSKLEIRTVILYCFERGLTTTQAKNEIAALKGTKWASYATIKRWHKKFLGGDMDLKDKKQTGRPPTANTGAILQLFENQPDLSTRKRASDVGTSHDTVWRHLKNRDTRPEQVVGSPMNSLKSTFNKG